LRPFGRALAFVASLGVGATGALALPHGFEAIEAAGLRDVAAGPLIAAASPEFDVSSPRDLSLRSLFAPDGPLLSTPDARWDVGVQNISYTVSGDVALVPLPPAAPLVLLALAALGLLTRRWQVS